MISIIAAMSQNRVIGHRGLLPWHLPEDLKRFRTLTLNNTIIMGRKTYDSIGMPLPHRRNIVISRQPTLKIDGADVVSSLEAAPLLDRPNAFIIGGSEIYRQAMPTADRIYLTLIHRSFEGDTYFPEIDPHLFKEISREDHLSADLPHSFIEYVRTGLNNSQRSDNESI